MFSNEEDDENQYMGLVARSYSAGFYPPAPQAGTQAGAAPPPAASSSSSSAVSPARSSQPLSVAPLERRQVSASFFPADSSPLTLRETHEPFDDGPSLVDTTPLLLRTMDRIIRCTSDASQAAHINRYQAALASRRMKLISTTLRQMVRPAPSPRLLTALQSLCLLTRQCAYDAADEEDDEGEGKEDRRNVLLGPDLDPLGISQCWPVLLCQHFTCRLLFQHAYRRLWTAWRMYSPTELEREDQTAEAKDRLVDADALLHLLFAARDACELESKLPSSVIAQHKRDMTAYYQRREMSPWRIFYQELEPTSQQVCDGKGGRDASSTSSPIRFRVLPTVYSYNSVPVVVKALCSTPHSLQQSHNDASNRAHQEEEEAAAMEYATEFLQDIACRCNWCHPHVVSCFGGYMERFVSTITTADVNAGGETEDERVADALAQEMLLSSDAQENAALSGPAAARASVPPPGVPTRSQPTDRSGNAERDGGAALPWSLASRAPSGVPVMTLGYVMEWQHAYDTGGPCVTLADVLFPSSSSPRHGTSSAVGHCFTLYESLDICAQVADALQYILEDAGDVPAVVRTSWLTVDPKSVFIVRAVDVDAATGAPLSPQQQQPWPPGQSSPRFNSAPQRREGSGAYEDASASHVDCNNSAVFSGSPSFFGAGAHATSGLHENRSVVVATTDENTTPLLDVRTSPSSSSRAAHALPTSNTMRGGPAGMGSAFEAPRGGPAGDGGCLKHFVVRYSPPCEWTTREVGSRWRPHPRATAPASYVLAQLFLALVTRQVPYATYAGDEEVQRRVFDHDNAAAAAAAAEAAASGVRVKPSGAGQGYPLPGSLPPALREWCRRALSLDHTQPAMELEALRDTLTTIRASLPELIGRAPLPMGSNDSSSVGGGDFSKASSREMNACLDAGII